MRIDAVQPAGIHLHGATRRRAPAALSVALLVAMTSATAAQFIDARDGDTSIAKLSIKDQTRVKLERGRITDVIGDVYNKDKNPSGRVVVVPDEEDGEIYLRPVDNSTRPIKIDLRTDRGKFSLLLQPIDMPGDTLILRSRGLALPTGSTALGQAASGVAQLVGQTTGAAIPRNAAHVRAIKAMTLAMAGPEVPADVEVRAVNQVITLWREAQFVLLATYLARDLVGESFELTNVSGEPMVIDERELYRDGVQSVSVKQLQLAPGARTAVWIVRNRAPND